MLRLISLFVLAFLLSFNAGADTLESVMMPGKVIQGHLKWEDDCKQCHKKFDKEGQNQLCKDCHKDINKDVAQKKGLHGKLKESRNCVECHTEHKGRAAQIAPINEKTFKHSQTDFELKGAHADATKTECKECHKPKVKYRDAPNACNACHKKDDKHDGTLGVDCESCHNEKSWKETREKFDHNKSDFALEGKHADVKCDECHKSKKYKEAPKDCYSCHKKDDKHKGTLGQKCTNCHTAKDWKEDTFDHGKDAHYVLRGKHATAKCESCHKPSATSLKLPTSCVACHKGDDKHEGTLGNRCEKCHVERSWSSTPGFDHNDTKFPLLDKHKNAKCQTCHKNGMQEKLPLLCNDCHKKDDDTKGHKGDFGTKCESCHTAKDWKLPSKFDHTRDTKYPLKEKHKDTKCVECHKGKLYGQNLKTDCYSCHKKDDDSKGHKGRYDQKCETCHIEKTWKTLIFDHDRDTKYKLLDKHRATKCDSCHKANLYRGKVKSTCISCHKSDDKHKGQEGDKCEDCHNAKSWKDAKFDHAKSKFPLLGKHFKVDCKSCHLTAEFKAAKSECISCHTKDDVHKLKLGPACETCHNARDWKAWDFDHDKKTKFKLDGGHKGIGCYECHRTPSKGHKLLISVTCGDCHSSDDVHDGGFGRQCERCHVSNTWAALKMGAGMSR
ncbi:cytochrome c3 family protein [Methylotenera sp.]|uniref:cytochrome c3 family protein n=1 Tax=Methylotenera sp. TaxID=2051956 RepID=UPI002489930D|nr:cytochrome c3 family protein [Methylotenera sp.]MDI1362881.1 cytochrome c3 family protein [Methylotenera sp.]